MASATNDHTYRGEKVRLRNLGVEFDGLQGEVVKEMGIQELNGVDMRYIIRLENDLKETHDIKETLAQKDVFLVDDDLDNPNLCLVIDEQVEHTCLCVERDKFQLAYTSRREDYERLTHNKNTLYYGIKYAMAGPKFNVDQRVLCLWILHRVSLNIHAADAPVLKGCVGHMVASFVGSPFQERAYNINVRDFLCNVYEENTRAPGFDKVMCMRDINCAYNNGPCMEDRVFGGYHECVNGKSICLCSFCALGRAYDNEYIYNEYIYSDAYAFFGDWD